MRLIQRLHLKYQPGTSAQEVAFGPELPADLDRSPLPPGTVNVNDIANSLESGEVLVAIAPCCDRLATDGADRFATLGSPHYHRNSLFAHAKWFEEGLNAYREAFAVLFVCAWRQCDAERKHACDLLLEDENFMDAFARSIGAI